MLYFAHSIGGHLTTSCGKGTAGKLDGWRTVFCSRECSIEPYETGQSLGESSNSDIAES